MTHYVVDPTQLAAAAAHTQSIAQHIRGEVAAMMAQLTTLESSWSGQAQTAFADCATRWHSAQIGVESALDQIANALGQASNAYADVESQTAGLFAG